MMRVAVISDVHAKQAALEAVLADIDSRGKADEIWCLGDLVGYGRDIAPVVKAVRRNCSVIISGNHDEAAVGRFPEFLKIVPLWLKGTLVRVRGELETSDYEWLAGLGPAARVAAVDLYHGSAADPVFGIIDSDEKAWWHLLAQNGFISLIGHSHRPLASALHGKEITHFAPGHGKTVDLSYGERWALNPGTAGLQQQEASIDRRQGWMLLDLAGGTATWYRVDV